MLLNLLQNALKFTFEGSISVEAAYDYYENKMIVSVSDTGIGITNEDKNKLFKLFGKLEATATLNTSGIGLGLSICKKLLEAFDGEIFLDDEYLEGTRFTFMIKAECKQEDELRIEEDELVERLASSKRIMNLDGQELSDSLANIHLSKTESINLDDAFRKTVTST